MFHALITECHTIYSSRVTRRHRYVTKQSNKQKIYMLGNVRAMLGHYLIDVDEGPYKTHNFWSFLGAL
jgi:hypothetical protein